MEKNKKEQVQKIIEHLNTKWGNRPCPMCSTSSWTVSDTIYELREFHGGNIVLGNGPIYPIVPVSCNNCGNTIIVNAIQAGAVERQESKPNITGV
jgi:hypothetical protein